MGKCSSFLAAQNIIIKLTLGSTSETSISPAETMSTSYRKETKRNYMMDMAGKTAKPALKPELATDTSQALVSLL